MTTQRHPIVTPNTTTDNARNRPAALPRRQRVASAIASAVISGVLVGGVVFGMTGPDDTPATTAGDASAVSAA